MTSPDHDLLVISLQAAVPLHINEIRHWPAAERARRARSAADTIAAHGDNILYKSKKAGDTAHAFNELALALAILAFQSGGVTFAGQHWTGPRDTDFDAHVDLDPDQRSKQIDDVSTGDRL